MILKHITNPLQLKEYGITDQWNRTENSEIVPSASGKVIHDIGDISSKWGKDRLNN